MPAIESLSAITLTVDDMTRSTAFYESIGFERLYGGPQTTFTSYRAGHSYLNLIAIDDDDHNPPQHFWGRAIFYVDNVDEMHQHTLNAGHRPEFPPRDAPWGERYFHLRDPDGHELSFARPLPVRTTNP